MKQPQQDCLSRVHHLLMVHRDSADRIIPLETPSGMTIEASVINAHTGNPIRAKMLSWEGNVTVHLVASNKYPGWYYVVEWRDGEYFTCGCKEDRQHGFCQHIDIVRERLGLLA